MPYGFSVSQNYPNPFNPTTTIEFEISTGDDIRIDVFNILGQHVVNLVDGFYPPGRHCITWDSRNAGGESVASGIYLYRLMCGSNVETKKMVLLK